MEKKDAIKIIVNCAKDYHANLENKNLLFIFGSPKKAISFEAVFFARHFLHLTGVEIPNGKLTSSSDFYKKALKGNLSPNDFSLSSTGTTEIKLLVLPQLMKIYRTAKMVGDFSFTKSALYTEKLAGNVTSCLGFVREDKYYVPNTALKEDIRNISIKPQQRILAVFRKSIKESIYSEACYIAKDIQLKDISFPKEIISMVNEFVMTASEEM